MSNKVMVVAGTRPELIKLAPVFRELDRRNIEYVFVWSGQHYDYEMSKVFIEQLGLPEPDFDLGVGSGSHAVQTAKAMIGVEEAIQYYRPSIVLALGDTNTVVATALASTKSSIPFAHIEAGLRSWNETMPEEINRKVADHTAQLLFTPSTIASINVLAEGIPMSRIFLVGNTIIDILSQVIHLAESHGSRIAEKIGIKNSYVLATIHRQENVDNIERLYSIVKAFNRIAAELEYNIIIPLHPRTRRKLHEYSLLRILESNPNIRLIKSLGYFEFIYLLKNAQVVLTDSGGVQEEAFALRIPTVTLRYNTERPETVLLGCNVLAGADTATIVDYTKRMIESRNLIRSKLESSANPYGDGKAAQKIVYVVSNHMRNTVNFREPDLRETPHIMYMIKEISKIVPHLDDIVCYIADDGSLTIERVKAVAAYVRSRIKVMKPWED